METKIIKMCYGDHDSLKWTMRYFKNNSDYEAEENMILCNPPILCRQIGMNFSDENKLKIINEINQLFLHEAYVKECMKEILNKYKKYEDMKMDINYKIIKDVKNNIPDEIFLEIRKFL